MRLKVSSAKWRSFCLGLNVLIHLEDEYQHIAWNGPLGRMEVNDLSIFYKNLNKS